MNRTQPSALFKTSWVSFRLPGYRPCRGTYEFYPYDNIPPLPHEQFTGKLQWLVPLNSEINQKMQRHRPALEEREAQMPQWTDNLQDIIASAQHLDSPSRGFVRHGSQKTSSLVVFNDGPDHSFARLPALP